MMCIRAALDGARRAGARACWCRNRRMAPTRRRRPPAAIAVERDPGQRDAAASISPRSRPSSAPTSPAIMLTNPNTCGLFEREIVAIAEAVHDGGRLFLLRRRQFQRHRRPGAARRSRHRRDAHQSAQDLLDAAWRRRAGLRGRWCWRRAWRPSRRCPGSCTTQDGLPAGRAGRGRRRHRRSAGSRAFTARWACSCARSPICMSHGADGLRQVAERCGAQRQLPAGAARRTC